MKFPNHILLDWTSLRALNSSQYWLFKYLLNEHTNDSHVFFFNFILKKNFKFKIKKNTLNVLLKNQSKHTIKYNNNNPTFFFKNKDFIFYKNFFFNNFKVKNKSLVHSSFQRKIYDYIEKKEKYNKYAVSNFFKIFLSQNSNAISHNNSLWTFFDIHFLRKEKIYTKLKYSRVPQYDIVSGGVAALFAGFLGFLICEKFGFELLDSGDFYTLMMYVVFFCFFSKLFLKLFTAETLSWSGTSPKWFFLFYKNVIFLFFNSIKFFRNKK